MVEEQKKYKYRAFISYSHKDEKFGNWLHKQLENYKIPKQLKKDYPHLPKKLFPIFRDIYELSAGDDLKVEIEKALKNSEALIILCSPKSAKSIWVNKEIIDFKKLHKDAKIIPIIIEGVPFAKESDNLDDELECFPDALKYEIDSDGNLTNEEIEIVASNAISKSEGRELAKLKLISGLLGVPFLDLYRRDEEQKKRTRRIQWSIGSLVFLVMLGLTIFSWIQMERAEISENKAQHSEKIAQEQLIIAIKKKQSLSILATKTINFLFDTNNKVVKNFLEDILASGEKEIFIEILIPLIKNSTSINDKDKIFFLTKLSKMNEKELSKLIKLILQDDMRIYQTKKMYNNIINKANKEASIRYIKESIKKKDFFKEECFKKEKSEICLKAISVGINTNYSNELILKFLKFYEKITPNLSARYYMLYAKFLVKEKKFKESSYFFEKAISMEPNNIEYIEKLIKVYITDKKYKKAFELQNKIVSYRTKKLNILEDNQTKYSYAYVKNIVKSPPKFQSRVKLMRELKKMFKLQYYIEPNKNIDILYPIYKNFIKSMSEWDEEGYIKIQNMIASSYLQIEKYKKGVEVFDEIISIYESNMVLKDNMELSWILDIYYRASWSSLTIRDYPKSIKYAKKGIYKDRKNRLVFELILAHGYLLSDNFEKAKNIYIQNMGKTIRFYNSTWEKKVLSQFRMFKNEGIKSDEFKKIEKIFERKISKEIFQTWKNPKNPEYKDKKIENHSNIIWITPSYKTCKNNGGKIENDFCKATYSDAINICHASGGNLPSFKEFQKIAFDCGGLELVSIEKESSTIHYAKRITSYEQQNLKKRIKKYQLCTEKKGFFYKNYWELNKNTSFDFQGANLAYHVGGGSAYIRCIGTKQ